MQLFSDDVDGDDLTYTIEGGNSISTIVDGDTILFMPAQDFNGVESFIITVSDGELSDVQIIVITVNPVNDIPIASDIVLEINEDEVTAIVLDGLDVDGDAIINESVIRVINFNKEENQFKVPFRIYSTFEYDAPEIELIEAQEILEDGDPLELAVVASDIDGDDLIFDYLPEENALIWFEENILNVKPDTDYYGQLTITVIVSDGILNSTTEFVLDVISVNDPPIADNMSVILYEDTSTTFNFNANDVDNFNLSYEIPIDQEPEHGDYNINSGFITYTPNQDYFGLDELFFIVSDGEFSADGTIYIEVLNVDDPFTVISEPSEIAVEDVEYTYQVVLDDPDFDETIEYLLNNELVYFLNYNFLIKMF